MKYWVFFLTFFIAISIFFCYRQLTSVSIPSNEQPQANKTNQPNPIKTPRQSKFEWKNQFDEFSNPYSVENTLPNSLEIGDYKIKKIAGKKQYNKGNPITDIYDAILYKDGKRVARFEGEYYPLGNEMSFGNYQFLDNSDKQLLINDSSYKYERYWIVNLNSKHEILFDSREYNMLWSAVEVLDIDQDGTKEISISRHFIEDFAFIDRDRLRGEITFKYNPTLRKYLPAPHIFPEVILEFIEDDIKKFESSPDERDFGLFLEIFLKYQYAGQEDEAWKFFDKYFSTETIHFNYDKDKVNTKEKLKVALQKDMIYKFIQNDLKKSK